MDVGGVLDQALAAFGGNQTQLAAALGVKGPTVSRWYSGKSGIDYESCLRLAKVTGLPAATVLSAAGKDPSLLPVADPNAPTEGHAELARLKRVVNDMYRLLEPITTPVLDAKARQSVAAKATVASYKRRVGDGPDVPPGGHNNLLPFHTPRFSAALASS